MTATLQPRPFARPFRRFATSTVCPAMLGVSCPPRDSRATTTSPLCTPQPTDRLGVETSPSVDSAQRLTRRVASTTVSAASIAWEAWLRSSCGLFSNSATTPVASIRTTQPPWLVIASRASVKKRCSRASRLRPRSDRASETRLRSTTTSTLAALVSISSADEPGGGVQVSVASDPRSVWPAPSPSRAPRRASTASTSIGRAKGFSSASPASIAAACACAAASPAGTMNRICVAAVRGLDRMPGGERPGTAAFEVGREHHQVGGLFLQGLEGLARIAERLHHMPMGREVHAAPFAQLRVAIDDEDVCHVSVSEGGAEQTLT